MHGACLRARSRWSQHSIDEAIDGYKEGMKYELALEVRTVNVSCARSISTLAERGFMSTGVSGDGMTMPRWSCSSDDVRVRASVR